MECNISKSTEAELTLCTVKILSHTRGRFLASVAYDQHYGTIYKPLKLHYCMKVDVIGGGKGVKK